MPRSYRATLKEATTSFSKRRQLQQRRQELELDKEMELLPNSKNTNTSNEHQFVLLEGVSQTSSVQAANTLFRRATGNGNQGKSQLNRQQQVGNTNLTPMYASSPAFFPTKRSCGSDPPPSTPPSHGRSIAQGATVGSTPTKTSRIILSPPVPRRVTEGANSSSSSVAEGAAAAPNSFRQGYNQDVSHHYHHLYHQHHHQQQSYYFQNGPHLSANAHGGPPYNMPTAAGHDRRSGLAANSFHLYHHRPPPICCYPDTVTYANTRIERVGDKSFQVYKLRLPPCLLPLLDAMVGHAEAYALTRPNGWRTDLYSLTKQDLALMDIPGMYKLVQPIVHVIKQSMILLFGKNCNAGSSGRSAAKNPTVEIDKNQPHILKYSVNSGHTGVELHHDRCDVTANLVLSRSNSYRGGGTILPDAGQVVRLEYGEFLLHPGALVHGGKDVTSGTRYLMVMFAHLKSK